MQIIRLEEVDSTNSYAKAHIEDLADCTIVHALRQLAGRGRLNRSWVDLGGDNLFVSLVLKPSNTFNEIYPNLTQYTSVVLCKVFESYGIHPQIKWPNDVLINGKKISGILSETVMLGKTLKGLVIGIGVNLNSSKNKLLTIPDKVATSLNLEVNKDIDVNEFLDKFLTEFFANYKTFLNEGFINIKDYYINKNCFLNKEISVQVLNEIKSGFAKSINDKGELILETKENKDIVLTIGDIL